MWTCFEEIRASTRRPKRRPRAHSRPAWPKHRFQTQIKCTTQEIADFRSDIRRSKPTTFDEHRWQRCSRIVSGHCRDFPIKSHSTASSKVAFGSTFFTCREQFERLGHHRANLCRRRKPASCKEHPPCWGGPQFTPSGTPLSVHEVALCKKDSTREAEENTTHEAH